MNIEVQQIITQIVGFLILLWFFRRFAWGPVSALLEDRRSRIASEFAKIQHDREALAAERKAFEARLSEIENLSREKIAEATLEGQRVAREITEAAREESRKIVEKAKESIQMEVSAAKRQLREDVVQLSMTVAEKVLHQQIDRQKNEKVVREMIDRVEELR